MPGYVMIDGQLCQDAVRVWFIGIRGSQYANAVRLWGRPEFAWPRATFKVLAEIPPRDKVIFGDGAFSALDNPAKVTISLSGANPRR